MASRDHDKGVAPQVNPKQPPLRDSSNAFVDGIGQAVARGVLPIDGNLWTLQRLIEIAGCSRSAAEADLRKANVQYRDFFANRWYEIAHIAERFPLIDPAVTPPKRGGARRKKDQPDGVQAKTGPPQG